MRSAIYTTTTALLTTGWFDLLSRQQSDLRYWTRNNKDLFIIRESKTCIFLEAKDQPWPLTSSLDLSEVKTYIFSEWTSDQFNISWPFLSWLLGGFAVNNMLFCCCTHPKVMTKMAKKCSTDQRFIQKRNTTYKIHTLKYCTLLKIMSLIVDIESSRCPLSNLCLSPYF